MNEHQYPFFHWMTGLFLCAFCGVGFILGLIVGSVWDLL